MSNIISKSLMQAEELKQVLRNVDHISNLTNYEDDVPNQHYITTWHKGPSVFRVLDLLLDHVGHPPSGTSPYSGLPCSSLERVNKVGGSSLLGWIYRKFFYRAMSLNDLAKISKDAYINLNLLTAWSMEILCSFSIISFQKVRTIRTH